MGVIIGVMVGYALGSGAGSGGWAELEEAWTTITASEEVRDFVSGGLSIACDVMGRRTEIIAGVLGVSDDLATLRPAA